MQWNIHKTNQFLKFNHWRAKTKLSPHQKSWGKKKRVRRRKTIIPDNPHVVYILHLRFNYWRAMAKLSTDIKPWREKNRERRRKTTTIPDNPHVCISWKLCYFTLPYSTFSSNLWKITKKENRPVIQMGKICLFYT